MLHKAWNSKGKMPYCFPRSSIKFQGHTVQSIIDFDPNLAFLDYRPVAAFKSLRFALLFVQTLIAAKLELLQHCMVYRVISGYVMTAPDCMWFTLDNSTSSINIHSQVSLCRESLQNNTGVTNVGHSQELISQRSENILPLPEVMEFVNTVSAVALAHNGARTSAESVMNKLEVERGFSPNLYGYP